jgi:hyperosmotically inducible protein
MQKNTIQKILCVSTAVMLVAITGCETTPKDERSEGRSIDDKHITENLEKSLEKEPTYKFSEVKVSTFAGIVQLSGFVNSDEQKSRAEEIAQDTDGVKQVVNGIALKPEMPATGRNSKSKVYSEPSDASTPSSSTNSTNSKP